VTGLERALDAEVRERIDAGGRTQVDAASVAAIAAVRSAEGHELLAPEAGAAAPTVAGLDAQPSLVDESHGYYSSLKRKPRR
jgi:hypothetical protein